jgi:hypothetical protein
MLTLPSNSQMTREFRVHPDQKKNTKRQKPHHNFPDQQPDPTCNIACTTPHSTPNPSIHPHHPPTPPTSLVSLGDSFVIPTNRHAEPDAANESRHETHESQDPECSKAIPGERESCHFFLPSYGRVLVERRARQAMRLDLDSPSFSSMGQRLLWDFLQGLLRPQCCPSRTLPDEERAEEVGVFFHRCFPRMGMLSL